MDGISDKYTFRVEIHYDIRSRRATFRAEISSDTIDQLAVQIRRAEAARSIQHRPAHKHGGTNETGPAETAGSQMIMGSSFSRCTWYGVLRTLILRRGGCWIEPTSGPACANRERGVKEQQSATC